MKPIPQYRGIIRLSYDADGGSGFRNKVAPLLKKAGFQNTKTGVWETPSETLPTIQSQLNQVMEKAATLTANTKSGFILDHIWIYIDRLS